VASVLFDLLNETFTRYRIWNFDLLIIYERPGQKSREYSAFGQITGLCPCKLQALSATRLAGQPALQGVIPIFIVGLSMYALF
jgi:hypothetical protein